MGCGGSKLDDSVAATLCKERCQLLQAAISHRYSLAQSHIAYLHSLKSVASSLQRFVDVGRIHGAPSSPFLPLPTQRKGDPDPGPGIASRSPPELIKPPSSSAAPIAHSHSNSGSHLQFHSDSDSDISGSPFHDHEIGAPSPPRQYMNYARSGGPAASISYEQRPQSPEIIHFGGSDRNPNATTSYSYPYPYPGYGGMNGFFGDLPQYSYSSSPPRQPVAAARAEPDAKEAAPPPPPPPEASTWGLFNLFESVGYSTLYTPSRDSKELREEEGIPDLEDDEYQPEVVKEVYGGQKFVAFEGDGRGRYERSRGIGGEVEYGVRSGAAGESSGVEYGVRLVDKNVIADEKPPVESHGNVAPVKARGRRSDSEVVSEIKAQFDRASDAGGEVSKILEVGKLPYCGKNSVYKVSSRMLHVIAPLSAVTSQPSTSKGTNALRTAENVDLSIDLEEDMWMKSNGLSSTLEKLYIWEKKLYEEIKVEENMQLMLERKCMRLKHLDERGAEAYKIESTRTLVRKLSTKIRIALHFVDSISSKISKLRDEDLWPQIAQLIQGLLTMWKLMLECHQRQCQVITEAGNLNAVASSDAHMEATMQLEQDLLNWILSFYAWISAQQSYVKALNGWLLKCIHYEPEVTPDGVIPFSPGRIGAPPMFVICNHWFQVMDRIKDDEKEVFDAMCSFSESVLQLWHQYCKEQRQRMMANKEMDRRLKALERDEQKMQKALDMVNKKLALVSEQNGLTPPGQIINRGDNAGIQSGLQRIFESMERFSSICVGAYEELHSRSEEVRLAWENAKVP